MDPSPPAAPSPSGTPGFLERLGPRARRRPFPRFGEAVAGAGGLMAVAGSLVTSFDQFGAPTGEGSGGRAPGIALSLVVVVVGYGLVVAARTGPAAAAGVAATIGGVPSLVWFLTVDGNGFGGPPDMTPVLALSAAAWLVSYGAGAGRGHSAYLGASALAVWLLVLEQIEPSIALPFFFFPVAATVGSGGVEASTTSLAMASLLFGGGYVLAARALDRRGLPGVGTALVAVGDLALVAGLSLLAVEQEAVVVGLFTSAVGAALALLGASGGRRATTWLGAFGVVVGLLVIIADAVDDGTVLGLVTMLVGAGVVAAATMAAAAMREPLGEEG